MDLVSRMSSYKKLASIRSPRFVSSTAQIE